MEINPYAGEISCVLWALLVTLQLKTAAATECTRGIPTPGYTSPKGDQWVKTGDELILNCTLNDSSEYNSSHLFWVGNKLANVSFVETLDDRTIQLRLPSLPESSFMVFCKAQNSDNESDVCRNQVNVGDPPLENVSITCTSYNFTNITCLWDLPASNEQFPTKWNFTQVQKHGSKGRKCEHPKQDYIKGCTCVNEFCGFASPVFKLTGENKWGTASTRYKFNQYEHVVMAEPTNLKLATITTTSAHISWTAPSSYKKCIKNLKTSLKASINYRISVRKKGQEKDNHFELNNPTESFSLQNLMPFTEYVITIQCRFVTKEYVNEWGFSNHIQLKTRPIAPQIPPKNAVATISKRSPEMNVTLYWTGLSEDQHFGEDFHYVIRAYWKDTELMANSTNDKEFIANSTKSYLTLSKLTILPYKFVIQAANEAGYSDEGSTIHLIKNDTLDLHVGDVTVHGLNENLWTYNVSWNFSDNNQLINTYLYWCVGNRSQDGTVQCDESGIHIYKEISDDINSYVLRLANPSPLFHFFGILAQSSETQRIYWSSCTITEYQDPKPPHYHIEAYGSTWVILEWNPLDCEDKAVNTLGYYIYVYKPNGEEVIKKLSVDKDSLNYNVTDLTPDTIYKFAISTRTRDKESTEDLLVKHDVQTKSLTTGDQSSSMLYIIPPAVLCSVVAFICGYFVCKKAHGSYKERTNIKVELPKNLEPDELTTEDIWKQSQGKTQKSQTFSHIFSNNNNRMEIYDRRRGDSESTSGYDRDTDITDALSMVSSPTGSCISSNGSSHDSGFDLETPMYDSHFKYGHTMDESQSPTAAVKGYSKAAITNFPSIHSNATTLDASQSPVIYSVIGNCAIPTFSVLPYTITEASEVHNKEPNYTKVVALYTHDLLPNVQDPHSLSYVLPSSSVRDQLDSVRVDSEINSCKPELNKGELQSTGEGGYAQVSIAMDKLPTPQTKNAYSPMSALPEPPLASDGSNKNSANRSGYVRVTAAVDNAELTLDSVSQQQQLDPPCFANNYKPNVVVQQPAPTLLVPDGQPVNHTSGYKSVNECNLVSPSPIVTTHFSPLCHISSDKSAFDESEKAEFQSVHSADVLSLPKTNITVSGGYVPATNLNTLINPDENVNFSHQPCHEAPSNSYKKLYEPVFL